jgi:hypothetical protein
MVTDVMSIAAAGLAALVVNSIATSKALSRRRVDCFNLTPE